MGTAYSYHRLRAGFDGELDEEQEGVRDFWRQHLEPIGIDWGKSFIDEPLARSKALWRRPAGARLYAVLRPNDVLLVPRLSTGFASIEDFLRVAKFAQTRSWNLAIGEPRYYSWEADAGGVLDAMDRQVAADRERRSEQVRAGHVTRSERSRVANQHAGYGFKLTGPPGRRRVVPDPEEQAVMATIAELRRSGKSYGEIARELMLAGTVTRRGVEWSPSRVARALPAAQAMFSATANESFAASVSHVAGISGARRAS